MRRAAQFIFGLIALLAVSGGLLARDAHDDRLAAFASEAGLHDVAGFVETAASLRATGRLPARYVTRDVARRLGWRPGDDLCRVAPGKVIGGDRFANREGRLPAASGRIWREADLDFACGKRGIRRLVWSSDAMIYVTLDHYETFRAAPP